MYTGFKIFYCFSREVDAASEEVEGENAVKEGEEEGHVVESDDKEKKKKKKRVGFHDKRVCSTGI